MTVTSIEVRLSSSEEAAASEGVDDREEVFSLAGGCSIEIYEDLDDEVMSPSAENTSLVVGTRAKALLVSLCAKCLPGSGGGSRPGV